MTDLTSVRQKIQLEATDYRSPVSEQLLQTLGGSVNWAIDQLYPVGPVTSSNVVAFTSNGTYTKPSNLRFADVTVIGAGGGGGSNGGVSGGGGGGGMARKSFTNASLGASIAVTVGTGGAGGIGASPGSTGGSSSFSTISATGGNGGDYPNIGGSGGSGSGGTVNLDGNTGEFLYVGGVSAMPVKGKGGTGGGTGGAFNGKDGVVIIVEYLG